LTVVDIAWHPESPLGALVDRYRTIALTADATSGGDGAGTSPSVRGDQRRLPLADDSVDCVLLLDPTGVDGALREVRRVLRPGGLAVVTVPSTPGPAEARNVRLSRRRGGDGQVTAALTDIGLVPEQVNHLLPLLHPMSIMSRILERARSGRTPRGPKDKRAEPMLCRVVAVLNRVDRADRAQGPQPRPAPSALVLGRKP